MHGDCRDLLRTLPDASIDSIVTDPPYELGFMGKSWDSTGIAYQVDVWRECLRVLKHGGHLLAFGGSRTYHRLACAIEDAGFQIRDQIMWVYGSGFPKSLDVSKAIDKAAGAEREVIRERTLYGTAASSNPVVGSMEGVSGAGATKQILVTAPATDAAKQWEGWGTALKPAHEPIVLARKPLDGTVAQNVLWYGTGALNIDECRVHRAEDDVSIAGHRTVTFGTQETSSGGDGSGGWSQNDAGRFPANFIHDGSDEVLELFPDSKGGTYPAKRGHAVNTAFASGQETEGGFRKMGDIGSAARFFYCAKASKTDRNEGLDNFPADKPVFGDDGGTYKGLSDRKNPQANHHPTVKPTTLMRYLIRLVTPLDGTVLDPFTGSGSTGKAAILEGFRFVGIEQDADYVRIADARIKYAEQHHEG
jgi:site-specific DNA-methyltransferase (adenine-specific)